MRVSVKRSIQHEAKPDCMSFCSALIIYTILNILLEYKVLFNYCGTYGKYRTGSAFDAVWLNTINQNIKIVSVKEYNIEVKIPFLHLTQ